MLNHSEIKRGANTCLTALRAMEALAEVSNNPGCAWSQHWEAQEAAIDLLVRASGTESPYLVGFVSMLGEYVHFCNNSGTPNIASETWKPRAAMTPDELAAHRLEPEPDYDEAMGR